MCGIPEMVHLHLHSDYSILDGYARIDDIITRVCSIGHKAAALTDHGTLGGIVEFYSKAKDNGIKPILGCEFYFLPYNEFVKERVNYHITVLAADNNGYENLLKLSYISYSEGFYYKPKITKKLLFEHNDGLIITTGCVLGYIPQLLLQEQYDEAERVFREFLDVFGDRFYVEVYDHGLKIEYKVVQKLLELSKKYNVKIIGTNDAHYAFKDDSRHHDVFLGIQTGSDITSAKRLRMLDDNNRLLDAYYIKSTLEMLELNLFKEHAYALQNTLEVAERCNVDIKFTEKLEVPILNTVDDFYSYVLALLSERVKGNLTEDMIERLRYEVDIIQKMGFVDYFLLVKDIVDLATAHNILVGPARGSVGGSLVAYALGIMRINPLDYGLYFERFLNPERVSPPDIDIDFEDEKRDLIIRLLIERYGADKVAHIATYTRIGVRLAIRDIARFYKISNDEINSFIKKSIPSRNDISFEEIESPETNPLYHNYVNEYNKYKHIIETGRHLYGRIRQSGIHASGIILAKEALYKRIPVLKIHNEGINVTQIEYEYCEKLGFVKVDILGLTTLTLIRKILDFLAQHGVSLDINSIPLDDSHVYSLFCRGLTTGIFQFESTGMKNFLVRLQPNRIEDIIALNALYRPGPLNEIDRYIARKHGIEEVVYLDDRLEPILEETYGIIVYQEQIMRIAQVIANYTLAEADLLRRAIGKKNKEIIDDNRERFIQRAMDNNTDPDTARAIFDLIEKFASYGFNKSHAVGYAILAYQTAYLKAYYPHIFFSVLLDLYAKKSEPEYIRNIYREASILGITMHGPTLNVQSVPINYHEIKIGLGVVRDISEQTVKDIKNIISHTRKENVVAEIMNKMNKKTIEALTYSGALDNILDDRDINSSLPKQGTLFPNSSTPNSSAIAIKIKSKQEIENEIFYLNAVLSSKYRSKYASNVPFILCDKSLYDNNYLYKFLSFERIYVTCRVIDYKEVRDKDRIYYNVQAYDNYGTFSFNCSANIIGSLAGGRDLVLELRRNEKIKSWYLSRVLSMNEMVKDNPICVYIYVNVLKFTNDTLDKWRAISNSNSSDSPGRFIIVLYDNDVITDNTVHILSGIDVDIEQLAYMDEVTQIVYKGL